MDRWFFNIFQVLVEDVSFLFAQRILQFHNFNLGHAFCIKLFVKCFLSLSPFVSLSFFVSLSLCLSLSLSLSLPILVSLSFSLFLSPSLLLYLSTSPSLSFLKLPSNRESMDVFVLVTIHSTYKVHST